MPDALSHKVRPMEEILRDSGFPYHVGQLTGAAEMAAHWMTLHEDEEVKAMGAKLGEVVRWFFAEDEPPR